MFTAPRDEPPDRRVADGAPPSPEAVAKEFANPLGRIQRFPVQFDWDGDVGPDDRDRGVLSFEPVIALPLSESLFLYSQTKAPIVYREKEPTTGEDEIELGDVLQNFYFTPNDPTDAGWTLGLGPAIQIPASEEGPISSTQSGFGPAGIAVIQGGPFTIGAQATHLWRLTGENDRDDLNRTTFEPFLAFTTPGALTLSLNAESVYDWSSDDLAVPLNLEATQVFEIFDQFFSVGGGVRYWAEESDDGPEGFGARIVVSVIFAPKL